MRYKAQNYNYRRKKKKNKLVFQVLFLGIMLLGVGFLSYSVTDFMYDKKEVGNTGISTVDLAYSATAEGEVEGVSLDKALCNRFEEVGGEAFHSAYTDRKWYLITNNPSDSTLRFTTIPSNEFVKFFNAYKDQLNLQVQYSIVGTDDLADLPLVEEESFELDIPLARYNPGIYEVKAIIRSDCGKFETEAFEYNLSYPVYVNFTLDWDGNLVKDETFTKLADLSDQYNAPITHFWNPRLYVSKQYSEAYRARATDWVKQRATAGDEIGLHLHMFFDMVESTGVTVRQTPAWGWNTHDGYDVMVYGYSQQELGKIIDWSRKQFDERGLPDPKVFRAGGWQADEDTLIVLQQKGFYADSSGRTRFTLGTNGIPVPWDLKVETQPYRPNRYDQNLGSGSPADILRIWEYPNNGGDCTALSSYEVLGRFGQIYNGRPVDEAKVFNFLSHPDYFYKDEPCVSGTLEGISKHSYENDQGPVIFETINNVHNLVAK